MNLIRYAQKLGEIFRELGNGIRNVVEVDPANPDSVTAYTHACRKLQGRKPVNLFEQQLDPLEVYQRQQYVFADQRRNDLG